ncbi:opacity protein [Croceicoccus sp. F390]|uniref:Opacity protein n=1 Tax=Croceicoccus esteveae TaxID=3075597 RepID=A0ABU2ZN37_9SPHN|nr:opacity protein [Croceicoccus sp. F390]MDT0576989.1 opacity protein [Croceicoccus sp. F390]
MKTALFLAGSVALLPAQAFAQDVTAPDGTNAFGFEPYVAIGGGYDVYDRRDEINSIGISDPTEGALIIGTVGANVPLGAFFVGAEGFGAYGFSDIDWEYGAAGRFGVRVGESGMFFGRVGYMWVEGENNFDDDDLVDTDDGPSSRDRDGVIYGIGAEVGTKDIGLGGLTGNSGVRLRLGVDTFKNFESFRPSAAVVFQF